MKFFQQTLTAELIYSVMNSNSTWDEMEPAGTVCSNICAAVPRPSWTNTHNKISLCLRKYFFFFFFFLWNEHKVCQTGSAKLIFNDNRKQKYFHWL